MNKIPSNQIKDDQIIIIGAGLSGAVAGKIIPNSVIVERDLTTPKVPQGFFVSHKQFKGFDPVKLQIMYLGEGGLQTEPTKELEEGYKQKIYGTDAPKASVSYAQGYTDIFLPSSWEAFYDKMMSKATVCEAAIEGMNRKTHLVKIGGRWIKYKALVFTMPLPSLLGIAGLKFEDIFDCVPFVSATIPVQYQWKTENMGKQSRECVIYDCRPDSDYWRITEYHNKLMVEMRFVDKVSEASLLDLCKKMRFEVKGQISLHRNDPGKIKCSDDELRKKYLRILAKYDIFPIGRYAAWKKKYYLADSIKNAKAIAEHFNPSSNDE